MPWKKMCKTVKREISVFRKCISLQSPGQIIMVNFVYISSSFIQSDRSAWRKNSLLCSLLINKLIVTQIWVNISKLIPIPEESKECILEELHRNVCLSCRELETVLFHLPTMSNTLPSSLKRKKENSKNMSTYSQPQKHTRHNLNLTTT